jgi:hypothetical protein
MAVPEAQPTPFQVNGIRVEKCSWNSYNAKMEIVFVGLKDQFPSQDHESVARSVARHRSGNVLDIAGEVAGADERIAGTEKHLIERIVSCYGKLQVDVFS